MHISHKGAPASLISVFIARILDVISRFLAIHSTICNKYLLSQESNRGLLKPKARLSGYRVNRTDCACLHGAYSIMGKTRSK